MDYYIYKDAPYRDYTNIVDVVKPFHDEFALWNNLPFWLGETGTRTNDTSLNIQWMRTVTSADTCTRLPNYMGLWYFHYLKNYIDHYLVYPPNAPITAQFKQVCIVASATTNLSDASCFAAHGDIRLVAQTLQSSTQWTLIPHE